MQPNYVTEYVVRRFFLGMFFFIRARLSISGIRIILHLKYCSIPLASSNGLKLLSRTSISLKVLFLPFDCRITCLAAKLISLGLNFNVESSCVVASYLLPV